jgi:large subunit ribosomal protein L18
MSSFRVRRDRTRIKIRKTSKNPRLSVFRSNHHTYCQIIDDSKHTTLVAVNSLQKDFAKLKQKSNIAAAEAIGKKVAEIALKKGIKQVVFDKGGYKYHGRVKAIAEKVREHGVTI